MTDAKDPQQTNESVSDQNSSSSDNQPVQQGPAVSKDSAKTDPPVVAKVEGEPPLVKPEETAKATADTAQQKQTDSTTADAASKSKSEKASSGKVKPEKTKPEKIAKVKTGRSVAWLAMLVSLVALTASGYLYWLSLQQQEFVLPENDDTEEQISRVQQQLETELAGLSTNLDQLSQRQVELATEDRVQANNMNQLSAQTASLALQLGDISQVSRRSWMLAEAEYLLRLANQRVSLQGDLDNVETMLSAVDSILREVDDVRLVSVRAALADELAVVRVLEPVDIEGIYLQLAALANEAENLPLLLPETDGQDVDLDLAESGLTGAWDSMLDTLGNLVQIRHRDEPVEPLLSSQEHLYVQQNIRLMLEQAQLALLQKRPLLYQASLEKAQEGIGRYFQMNNGRETLIRQLSELQDLPIAPGMPDISTSLRELKQYLNQVADELASDTDSTGASP